VDRLVDGAHPTLADQPTEAILPCQESWAGLAVDLVAEIAALELRDAGIVRHLSMRIPLLVAADK